MAARYSQITFRVNDLEREAIRRAAKMDHRKEGDFIRVLTLKHIGYDEFDGITEDSVTLDEPQESQAEEEFGEEAELPGEEEVTGYLGFTIPERTGSCAHEGCGHPEGAHMNAPDLGARCILCPPGEEAVHAFSV